MNLCEDCNIVSDLRKCPLCEAKERLDDLESKIEELEKENKKE